MVACFFEVTTHSASVKRNVSYKKERIDWGKDKVFHGYLPKKIVRGQGPLSSIKTVLWQGSNLSPIRRTRRSKQSSMTETGSRVITPSLVTFFIGLCFISAQTLVLLRLGIFLMLFAAISWLFALFFLRPSYGDWRWNDKGCFLKRFSINEKKKRPLLV